MQVLPNDKNAEIEILATILVDNKKLIDAIEIIEPTDFYTSAHRIIFEAMNKMFMSDKEIDLVNLCYELGQERLKGIGGMTYLSQISGSGLGSTNIKTYCDIVKDKSKRRSLIKAGNRIVQASYDDKKNIDELIDETQNVLLNNAKNEGLISDVDLMAKTMMEIEKRFQNGGEIPGIKTGLRSLDNALNGLKRGELTIIAARPSIGKTLTALNLTDNILKEGYKVALFEMEMTEESLGMRRLNNLALVDGMKLQRGQLTSEEWDRVTMASQRIAAKNGLYTDTSTGLRVVDIKAKAKKLKQKFGLDVIIVDHLGLMKMPKADRHDLAVGEITMSLKNLAKELDINVILLSQLSRANGQRSDKRPQLTDLRDSGSIEQDADLVIGLHREEYYNPNTEDKGIIEFIILKQRNGRVGTLKFAYVDKYQKISELTR